MRILKYFLCIVFGFLIAYFWFKQQEENRQVKQEINIMVDEVKQLQKLVVTQANFSELFNHTDSKKYFFDYISFDKKAIVSVNAKVEVGFDLSKLDIEVDSINKRILIHKIPEEEVLIAPKIQYFDLQQSNFNSFSKEDLNTINQQSIEKIKNSTILKNLKKEAKHRLFTELSKFYIVSSKYNWAVVDKTESLNFEELLKL